ncbi:MAG: glutamine amidotransferase [Bacillota bacterium]|nr:glutamine amidotransferase [Bacillota bacterium]
MNSANEHFVIAHMYPDLMNLYGDWGNLICIKRRMEWRGLTCEIRSIGLEQSFQMKDVDMIFMGGGSDREQNLVYHDLIQKSDELMNEVDDGLPVLCVCGAYQLLGKEYRAYDGTIMKGLGLFDLYTIGEKDRLIGNIAIESELDEDKASVVGFENHGGRTYLDDAELSPFGSVLRGYGNNGKDGGEGLHYRNLIGTYLHGPLLPKNPVVADYFIRNMAKRKGVIIQQELDDQIENFAHQQVKEKLGL